MDQDGERARESLAKAFERLRATQVETPREFAFGGFRMMWSGPGVVVRAVEIDSSAADPGGGSE